MRTPERKIIHVTYGFAKAKVNSSGPATAKDEEKPKGSPGLVQVGSGVFVSNTIQTNTTGLIDKLVRRGRTSQVQENSSPEALPEG